MHGRTVAKYSYGFSRSPAGRGQHRPRTALCRAAELPDGWTSGRLHLALVRDGAVLARSAVDVDDHTGFVIGDDRS